MSQRHFIIRIGSDSNQRKNDDGSLVFTFPIPETAYLSMGDVSELGSIVATAFRNPQGWGHGDFIAAMGDHLTLGDTLKALSTHTGLKVTSNTIPREVYAKFFPGADEVAEMFEWFNEYGYYGHTKDVYSGHKAKGSALKSFSEWLKETNFKFTNFA